MEALLGLLSQYWTLEILVQVLVPISLLVYRLPLRPHAGARILGVLLALVLLAVLPVATGLITGIDEVQALALFSGLIALFVCAICFVFEVTVWPALFCATAGYAIQNMASGATLLVETLIMHSPRRMLHGMPDVLVNVLVTLAVYVVSYLVLVRSLNRKGLTTVENKVMLLMFLLVVVTVIGFDLLIKNLVYNSLPFEQSVLLRMVHLIVCGFLLFSEYELLHAKRAEDERIETERLLAERARQYRMSRENIEAINIKCHDIRHQIRHLADKSEVVDRSTLADIEREVSVYDSSVKSGNEALDTILTEKSLTCSNEGITLSVVADGHALDFMAAADIYSLFGNALDNAIEAVRGVDDPDRRSITLMAQRKRDMVSVNVENYVVAAPHFSADGMPQTTKADKTNHGFGMRSMRATAERYGGSLHAGTEDGVFYLNVLLAIPE